jgi:hypothetical protein
VYSSDEFYDQLWLIDPVGSGPSMIVQPPGNSIFSLINASFFTQFVKPSTTSGKL